MRRIGICFTIWHKRSDVFLHTKHGRERGRRGREAEVGGIAERQNDEEGREVLPQGLHLFRTGAIIVPEMLEASQLLTRLLFQDLQGLFKEDRYTTSSFNLHLHPYTALS